MKKHGFALLVLLFFTVAIQAQQTTNKGVVEIKSHNISIVNGRLYLKLLLNKNGLVLPNNKSLALLPVLQDDQGNKVMFPEIWFNGKNRQKIHQRDLKLNKGSRNFENVMISLNNSKRDNDIIDYQRDVVYEEWMKNAKLYLQEDECGCAGSRSNVEMRQFEITREKTIYTIKPHLSFISPPKEEVKMRNESFEAYLDFLVGSYVIKEDFRGNSEELNRLNETIISINNDETLSLTRIKLIGKTSPEGSMASNHKLAYNRATALKDYLQRYHDIDETLYKVEALGEDWDKFKILATTDFSQQQELLSIINSVKDLDIKEKEIRKINNGILYKELNKEIFPQLRRVTCEMDFTVRNFNLEESKALIYQNPQRLSLDEIYAVARNYPVGSTEYSDVFEIAAKLFPDDPITNNNAAAASILAGHYEKALSYLVKLKPTAEYYNNMGVLELLVGNYEKASNYFEKSKAEGSKDALLNMQELENKKNEDNY